MLLPLLLAGGAAVALAAPSTKPLFKNLVTFGDSYTDDGRLGYYINHGGNPPPPGGYQTVSNVTATGGLAWGQWVAQYTGANYIDYGVSGATCSNEIISRYFSAINKPFPSVLDDEIPSFKADVSFDTLYPDRTRGNTVYALWIGTNDLGFGAFLSDSQKAGTTISDYVECIWQVFDNIYQTGGRNFVLLNNAPLELAPLYALPENGGTADSQFWQNKTSYNMTEYNSKIKEYTTSANKIFSYGVPFELVINRRWPGAQFSLFDVHGLISDIHDNPAKYFDGPANVTGYYHHCDPFNNSACTDSTTLSINSFLWYDELHPTTYTSHWIAKTFIDVVAGNSTFGVTYK